MINKKSSTAIYEQIAAAIKNDILSHKYPPGSCLGTHTELADTYGVSLVTIRRALALLIDENLVVTKQGKGTFVNTATLLQDDNNRLSAVSTILENHNLEPITIVRDMRSISTPDYLPSHIQQLLGSECVFIERLHRASEHTVGYTKLYLPTVFGRQFTMDEVSNTTIYKLYRDKLNIPLGRGVQLIQANRATKKIAELLEVEDGSPLLTIFRESYSSDGRLIEYMEANYEYTQYSFKVELELDS